MQLNALADAVVDVMRPLAVRVKSLEATLATKDATISELMRDVSTLRERVAVLEVKQPIPGPMGAPGRDGRDGQDGVNWTDLSWVGDPDDDRAFLLRATTEQQSKELGRVVVGWPIWRGTYAAGRLYRAGDIVTYGGSAWTCTKDTATARPETDDGAPFWKLMVKRGDRGRDLRSESSTPIVRVKP